MNPSQQRTPNIATLAMAAAIGPLAMNIYLPSLPSVQSHFDTTAAAVQLSVSLYLASTAAMQLIIGPLSDKYGRRPILLLFFLFTLLATLVCIFATSIEMFLLGRVLQASSATGIVLSRAVVRDLVKSEDAASKIAYVTMGMTLAPMVGPAIGGLLEDIYGWQAPFWLMFFITAFIITVIWIDLPETNRFKGGSFYQQFHSFPELFRSKRFLGYSATNAFSSGAYFAFLGGGPLLAIQYYKLSPTTFGLFHIFIALGYMIGNFLAGRYSKRIGLNRMMIIGNIAVLLGLFSSLILTAMFAGYPILFFGLVFFVGLGNGITLPNANAGIVNVRPKIAGAASGLGGSLQIGGGAILAAFTGYYVSFESGPAYLLAVMILSIICAIASTLYVIHIDRLRLQENTASE